MFFYSGSADTTVPRNVSVLSSEYHERLNANVKNDFIDGFEHILPNDVGGHEDLNPKVECSDNSERPYRTGSNYCEVDMAGELLTHIYGDLEPRVFDEDIVTSGLFAVLDTSDLTNSKFEDSYLLDYSFLFVPNACLDKACDFHIHFHGCM